MILEQIHRSLEFIFFKSLNGRLSILCYYILFYPPFLCIILIVVITKFAAILDAILDFTYMGLQHFSFLLLNIKLCWTSLGILHIVTPLSFCCQQQSLDFSGRTVISHGNPFTGMSPPPPSHLIQNICRTMWSVSLSWIQMRVINVAGFCHKRSWTMRHTLTLGRRIKLPLCRLFWGRVYKLSLHCDLLSGKGCASGGRM